MKEVCKIKKGDNLYFKGKYGIYHRVTVKSVQGNYAYVIGGFAFGKQKVRIDKLVEQPSKEFKKFAEEVEKEMCEAQEKLWELKDSFK